MTKRRYLRRSIQTTIEAISFLIVGFLCMLEDFSLSFVPVLFTLCGVLGVNAYVLNKYGKY
jgi:hypothetical protein